MYMCMYIDMDFVLDSGYYAVHQKICVYSLPERFDLYIKVRRQLCPAVIPNQENFHNSNVKLVEKYVASCWIHIYRYQSII